MVSLALPILSTKNLGKNREFLVSDSGQTRFPNDEELTTYLDVISVVDNAKYRFGLNWTNEKFLSSEGFLDTEDLHGKIITIEPQPTKFKNQDTEGLRITKVSNEQSK